MDSSSEVCPHGHRVVRSFVRRAGRITDAQQRHLDTLWELYGLEVNTGILDFVTIFGRHAPIWLEIGFGNGSFLANLATTHPEINLLGIDVHRPGVGRLLGHLHGQGISNVRIFCADAVDVLHCCMPMHILERVYILFPDPWPKKRHHKRRLIQPNFVTQLGTKLSVGGQLYLATDWDDYAQQMMTVLSALPDWNNPLGPQVFSPRPAERLPTRFEKRGLNFGHRVWDLTFMRKL